MNKKPVIAFIIGDDNHKRWVDMCINSIRKFHTEEELPIKHYGQDELAKRGFFDSPQLFYKATPMFTRELIDEYDKVIQINADTIITGDLNHVLAKGDYDIGSVSNYSRTDFKVYGPIATAMIHPAEYVNNGFTVVTSKAFVEHWWNLCNHPHFSRYPYREQDMLNLLFFYGGYKTKNFDDYDEKTKQSYWQGLLWRGEGPRVELNDKQELTIKASEDGYPIKDVIIKAIHFAGGAGDPTKMRYQLFFQNTVIKYMDWLVADTKLSFGEWKNE